MEDHRQNYDHGQNCFSLMFLYLSLVLPSGKNPPAHAGDARDLGSILGLGRWRRKWQVTPVFLPGKFHGQEPGGLVHGVSKSLTQLSTSISSLLVLPRKFVCLCCPGWSRVSSVLLTRFHFFSGSGYFPSITTCCLICPSLRDSG